MASVNGFRGTHLRTAMLSRCIARCHARLPKGHAAGAITPLFQVQQVTCWLLQRPKSWIERHLLAFQALRQAPAAVRARQLRPGTTHAAAVDGVVTLLACACFGRG